MDKAEAEITFEGALRPTGNLILATFMAFSNPLRSQIIGLLLGLIVCTGLFFIVKRERKGWIYLVLAATIAFRNWLFQPPDFRWLSAVGMVALGVASVLVIAKTLNLGWRQAVSPICLLGFFLSITLLLPSFK